MPAALAPEAPDLKLYLSHEVSIPLPGTDPQVCSYQGGNHPY